VDFLLVIGRKDRACVRDRERNDEEDDKEPVQTGELNLVRRSTL
jgi:hypothetical protein